MRRFENNEVLKVKNAKKCNFRKMSNNYLFFLNLNFCLNMFHIFFFWFWLYKRRKKKCYPEADFGEQIFFFFFFYHQFEFIIFCSAAILVKMVLCYTLIYSLIYLWTIYIAIIDKICPITCATNATYLGIKGNCNIITTIR